RVATLLDQYNHPPGSENQNPSLKEEMDDNSPDQPDAEDDNNGDSSDSNSSDPIEKEEGPAGDNQDPPEEKNGDTPDSNPDNSSDDQSDEDENKKYFVRMTPEIDAQFDQIAEERITRSPFRYYIFVPAKRAAALWFDSLSLYYPF